MNLDYSESYKQGNYTDIINEILKVRAKGTNFQLERLLCDCYIRANRMYEAVLHATEMYQIMQNLDGNEAEFKRFYYYLKNKNVLNTGLRVLRERDQDILDQGCLNIFHEAMNELDLLYKFDNLLIIPVIWPVAFGDMIVFNQFCNYYKQQYVGYKLIVIAPMNRPDLQQLFHVNRYIDHLIDISLMDEESDRLKSLVLMNGNSLNISKQNKIIDHILHNTEITRTVEVVNMRYFPMIYNGDYLNGERMWEFRARLWSKDKIELPKFAYKKRPKKHQIAIHFRNANYADPQRNINDNYAQDLIDQILEVYPEIEIVRLGDKSMTKLSDVRNASHEGLTVIQQIEVIQESKLFLGSHSAPQHLAVACTDTPVICIGYTAQETTTSMDDNTARFSYEPIGEQVKKIFYNKVFDADNNELIPVQQNEMKPIKSDPAKYAKAETFKKTPISEIIDEVRKWLK
jgi:ADP-heptose:LPS heptosyltransferase